MRKFTIFIITFFLLSYFHTSVLSYLVSAQETLGGISIYPAFVEIEAGKSFELTVRNDSSIQKEVSITPALFQLNTEANSLKLLDEFNEENVSAIKFDRYMSLNKSKVQLSPNEAEVIEIDYIEKIADDVYLGVLVSETTVGEQVSVSAQAASIILDIYLDPQVLGDFDSNISIKTFLGLPSINLTDETEITTVLTNNSTKIVKPSGEILITAGVKRLDTISLTQKFPSNLFPTKELIYYSTYKDPRPFWERIGFVSYTQQIKLNDKTITESQDVFYLPWQAIVIGLGSLVGLVVVVKVLRKGKKKIFKN